MNFSRRILAAGGVAAVITALLSAPAQAQATRTWVSGVGDDANPCSRTAPCKTFAGAISKTAAGGVINAIDSGGFGGVTITKGITIDGGGNTVSSLVSATHGIVINAPATSDVVLRNIDITGVDSAPEGCTSLSGVRILGARSVRIDHVAISGFKQAIEAPLSTSSPDIFVDMAFNDLDIANNCSYGVRLAPEAGHHGRATIDGTTITGSNIALSVAAGAEAWVSNSRFYLNNLGVQRTGGARAHSLCNNSIAGNATVSTFTDDWRCAGVAPPVPAPVKYCAVPKLKGKTVTQARSSLKKAGCKLGKVSKQKSSKSKRKKVLSQNIPAKVQVKRGTSVTIKIGK